MKLSSPIPLEKIKEAQVRISSEIVRTPLVRLNVDELPAEIYLKLENLQPIRSFKMRAACNALNLTDRTRLENGVWTVSSGNWAQGLAWFARKLGIKCTTLVPENISQAKEAAISRLDAHILKVPINTALEALRTERFEGMDGLFIHPFSDPRVIAGNGTIGLEIFEDFPELDTIVIPWGGGGLACGIASAIRVLKPNARIYAAEVETCAPLAAAFKTGGIPHEIPYSPSFITAIGYPFLFPEMWNMAKQLLDGSLVVGIDETTAAIQMLASRNSVIVEGAGAVPVAAALSGKAGKGKKTVCVVSGGNIDPSKLAEILGARSSNV